MVMDIVVIADLGSAGNLVRNLLLLSDQFDWPLTTNRFSTINTQYLPNTKLENWLVLEYRLRFWLQQYGVDISDNINMLQFKKRRRPAQPVVYLNHSAFYQQDEYKQLKNEVATLYVAPVTELGLSWQIRSYCEKKTVDKLHNFTFETEIDQQKQQYCIKHGIDAYYQLNIKNFKEIVNQRQKEFGTPDLTLELLLTGTASEITALLFQTAGIRIDVSQASQVLNSWKQLHWPLEQTTAWKYNDN